MTVMGGKKTNKKDEEQLALSEEGNNVKNSRTQF
jgi:hypothetical protein